MKKRIRREKVAELVNWDKDSVMGKKRKNKTKQSKSKQIILSLGLMGRQVFKHLHKSEVPPHVSVTLDACDCAHVIVAVMKDNWVFECDLVLHTTSLSLCIFSDSQYELF